MTSLETTAQGLLKIDDALAIEAAMMLHCNSEGLFLAWRTAFTMHNWCVIAQRQTIRYIYILDPEGFEKEIIDFFEECVDTVCPAVVQALLSSRPTHAILTEDSTWRRIRAKVRNGLNELKYLGWNTRETDMKRILKKKHIPLTVEECIGRIPEDCNEELCT